MLHKVMMFSVQTMCKNSYSLQDIQSPYILYYNENNQNHYIVVYHLTSNDWSIVLNGFVFVLYSVIKVVDTIEGVNR